MLLGCDVLELAPLIWNGKESSYVVHQIPKQKSRVSRVKLDPVEISKPSKAFSQIHLLQQEKLTPYQTCFVSVMVNRIPGTTLLVHPQPWFSHSSYAFLVQVTLDNHIYLPLTNSWKSDNIFKAGPISGSVKKAEPHK